MPTGDTEESGGDRLLNTTVPSEPTDLRPIPEIIGGYRVLGELGRGGMGVVYEAYDDRLERRIALKVVELATMGPRSRERMRREARALARVSHPNVIQVFEVGTSDDGSLFLAMEHVEGQTLRRWRQAESRHWREILRVYGQAAAGLAAAHHRGLVHRDFKPDNAIIGDDGRVRVLDFGLARTPGRAASDRTAGGRLPPGEELLTEAGVVVGTPAYMAPEQFLGQPVDARTDQFALCVALYEALYGNRPFEGQTRLALLDSVTAGQIRSPPNDRDDPPWVFAAVRRGLQTEPSARFDDIDALLRALTLNGPRRRGRWIALGLLAAGVLAWEALAPGRSASSCAETARRQWQTGWTPEHREAVTRALTGVPVPYAEDSSARTVELLDEYGAHWIEEHAAACTAKPTAGPVTAADSERRTACLAARQRRFGALVEVLANADAMVVQHAVQAADSLPPPSRCASPSSQLPAPVAAPALRARIDATSEQLDRVITLHQTGQYDNAQPVAEALVHEAESLGAIAMLSEARLLLGLLSDAQGDSETAATILRTAYFDAHDGGLDELAVRAAIRLVFTEGYRLNNYEAADTWAEHARTGLERLGGPSYLEPRLDMAMANVDGLRGAHTAARAGHLRAYEGFVARRGPRSPIVAQAMNNLANLEFALSNYEAALERAQQGLAINQEVLGPQHPAVGTDLNTIGSTYLMMGRLDEAQNHLQQARDIRLLTFEPDHPDVLYTRSNIALIYWMQDEPSRALEEQQQILSLQQQRYGPDDLALVGTLSNMAGTLNSLDRSREARDVLVRGLTILELEGNLAPDHPDFGRMLYNLATIEYELEDEGALDHARRALANREHNLPEHHDDRIKSYLLLSRILERQGDLGEALELATTALRTREQSATRPEQLAKPQFAVARLLWTHKEQYAVARVLARRARDGFDAADNGWSEHYAEVVEWLDTHPWPSRPLPP